MDKETLRQVQLTQLEILKEVKRVCMENAISYWLDSGTFLGAVRHGGFIPWDDDVDVGMLRDDYERFLKVCRTELRDRYVLQDWDDTRDYPYCFAKVRKRGTIYREIKAEKLEENGVYIDVFPYDKFPLDKGRQLKQHIMVDTYKRIILIKDGYMPWRLEGKLDWRRYFLFLPIRILSSIVGLAKAKKLFIEYQQKYNHLTENYDYFPSGVSQYGNWVIKRDFLETLEERKFEDDSFMCPSSAHEYLSVAYGDYMTPPPEDRRYLGHSIIEVQL